MTISDLFISCLFVFIFGLQGVLSFIEPQIMKSQGIIVIIQPDLYIFSLNLSMKCFGKHLVLIESICQLFHWLIALTVKNLFISSLQHFSSIFQPLCFVTYQTKEITITVLFCVSINFDFQQPSLSQTEFWKPFGVRNAFSMFILWISSVLQNFSDNDTRTKQSITGANAEII